jgi:Holliday junction resolvase
VNSRAKGCRGEREWRDQLREAGFLNARRGQQFSGGTDSPDVVCPELPTIHFEVKRVEAGNPYNWHDQATTDAGSKIPVVAHKRNGRRWLAILSAEDLLDIIRRSDLVDNSNDKGEIERAY